MNPIKCAKTKKIKNSKEYFWNSQPTHQKDQISLFLQEKSVAKNYFVILWNMSYPSEAEARKQKAYGNWKAHKDV